MKTKTITIGDLHGKDIWKKCADLETLSKTSGLETEYDKYIFIGDYVDSFDKTDKETLDNLQNIILLKKNYPDKIILLWGNHDLPYYLGYKGHECSGHRMLQAHENLNNIFESNKDLFQMAFQIKNHLWTHAGIHKGWYNDRFLKTIDNDIEYGVLTDTMAEQLNKSFERNDDCLFDVGYARGGSQTIGGPFWLDKMNLHKPLEGYHQVVGHSKVKYIRTDKAEQLAGNPENTSVTFTDCLDTIESFYKLEI